MKARPTLDCDNDNNVNRLTLTAESRDDRHLLALLARAIRDGEQVSVYTATGSASLEARAGQ
jgi:hypothetical protein